MPSEVRRILGLFFIDLPLLTSGFPSADDSDRVAALDVVATEEPTPSGSPQENEPVFRR
jgi:hypothetical protein